MRRRKRNFLEQCRKGCLALIYIFERKAQLTAEPEALRKMTASSRNVKTSYDVNCVEDQEINENKENNWTSLRKHWKRRGAKSGRKTGWKDMKTGIVFDRDTDGRSNDWPSVLQELQEQRAIAETAYKLADKTEQRRKRPGRTRRDLTLQKRSRGS